MAYTYDTSSTPLAYVELHGPQGECQNITLESGTSLSIGSHESCDLTLVGADISAMHCVVKFLNGILWIQDWNTRSGTLVDGHKVVGETELAHGTIVQLGAYQFTIGLSPPVDPEEEHTPTATVIESSVQPTTASSNQDTPEILALPEVIVPRDIMAPPQIQAPFDGNDEVEHPPQDGTPIVRQSAVSPVNEEPWDTLSDETLQLLQEEIVNLQQQLQEQIIETDRLRTKHQAPSHDSPLTATPSTDSIKPQRTLELLDELERSDERIASLEELLLITEEASLAEQEERRQIEAWIGEVEIRFGQREAETTAEMEVFKRKLHDTLAERNRLEVRLQAAASPQGSREAFQETLDQLRTQNSTLVAELEQQQQHVSSLERNVEQLKEQLDPDALQRRLDDAVREERLQMAQERAEMARQRVAMARELEQIPQTHRRADPDSETKFKALRQHLKEIHVQEQQDKKERSIGSRLAKLWNSLE
ncbi:MAG: FHA domain-containing protein [Planctomycetota bacterium]|nr:FHA domain-containing protein [Planctomycetota bacterium]